MHKLVDDFDEFMSRRLYYTELSNDCADRLCAMLSNEQEELFTRASVVSEESGYKQGLMDGLRLAFYLNS